MSMYLCNICDDWKDNDYHPAEFIQVFGNRKSYDEYPVCEDCFAEHEENKDE